MQDQPSVAVGPIAEAIDLGSSGRRSVRRARPSGRRMAGDPATPGINRLLGTAMRIGQAIAAPARPS